MSILEERLPLLETVTLDRGSHDPDGAFCVMELAAHLAGERWSDSPDCVSPVIASFLRAWNDRMGETDRQILKPLIPLTIGTRSSEADELVRSWMAVDWLARECAPAWLRLAGLTSQAEQLEQLAPLLSPASAQTAQPALDAAWAAAGAAARDVLQPTVKILQASALQLVERMCQVGR